MALFLSWPVLNRKVILTYYLNTSGDLTPRFFKAEDPNQCLVVTSHFESSTKEILPEIFNKVANCQKFLFCYAGVLLSFDQRPASICYHPFSVSLHLV